MSEEPKFKIGDRVKIVDKHKDSLHNGIYTIKALKRSAVDPNKFIYKLNKEIWFYVDEKLLEEEK